MRIDCHYCIRAVTLAVALTGCGHYPAYLSSRGDIASTSKKEYHLNVSKLSIEDFPALAKFTKVYEVEFQDNTCTDEKLDALARIGFTNLAVVDITDCPRVTDKGIVFLSRIPSLTGLGLRGASITDGGMQTLATAFPHLTGIGVQGCPLLTVNGFMNLTHSRTITGVGISGDPFSPKQIENIISNVSNVTFWTIDDPHHRLDRASLRQLGEQRKIRIDVVNENGLVEVITRPQQARVTNGSD